MERRGCRRYNGNIQWRPAAPSGLSSYPFIQKKWGRGVRRNYIMVATFSRIVSLHIAAIVKMELVVPVVLKLCPSPSHSCPPSLSSSPSSHLASRVPCMGALSSWGEGGFPLFDPPPDLPPPTHPPSSPLIIWLICRHSRCCWFASRPTDSDDSCVSNDQGSMIRMVVIMVMTM